jgi:hypothetical protein
MQNPEWVRSFRGVLISPETDRSHQEIALLKAMPDQWSSPPPDAAENDLSGIVLTDVEQDTGYVPVVAKNDDGIPQAVILCYGPAQDNGWRAEAHAKGAFTCLSESTPLVEQVELLGVAIRYQTLMTDLEKIRQESNRICQTLLESFGNANESLVVARNEAEQIRDDLENVHERILRAFI